MILFLCRPRTHEGSITWHDMGTAWALQDFPSWMTEDNWPSYSDKDAGAMVEVDAVESCCN